MTSTNDDDTPAAVAAAVKDKSSPKPLNKELVRKFIFPKHQEGGQVVAEAHTVIFELLIQLEKIQGYTNPAGEFVYNKCDDTDYLWCKLGNLIDFKPDCIQTVIRKSFTYMYFDKDERQKGTGHVSLFHLLLKSANLSQYNKQGEKIVNIALSIFECIPVLSCLCDDTGCSPLFTILNTEMPPTSKQNLFLTVLHKAIKSKLSPNPLFMEASRGFHSLIRVIVDKSLRKFGEEIMHACPAVIGIASPDGWFPIHFACNMKGNQDHVSKILHYRPDHARKLTREGLCPLDLAARNDDQQIIQVLEYFIKNENITTNELIEENTKHSNERKEQNEEKEQNERKEQKRKNQVIVLTMTEEDFENERANTKSNKKNKPINNIESIVTKKRRGDEVAVHRKKADKEKPSDIKEKSPPISHDFPEDMALKEEIVTIRKKIYEATLEELRLSKLRSKLAEENDKALQYLVDSAEVCSALDLDLKDEIQKFIDKNKEDNYEEKLGTEIMLKKKILEAYIASEKDMFAEVEKNYDSKAKYIDDMMLQKCKLLDLEIAEKRSKLEEETNNIMQIAVNMIKEAKMPLIEKRQTIQSLKNQLHVSKETRKELRERKQGHKKVELSNMVQALGSKYYEDFARLVNEEIELKKLVDLSLIGKLSMKDGKGDPSLTYIASTMVDDLRNEILPSLEERVGVVHECLKFYQDNSP